jgi:tetratricopeptide (TPR) repeat protein
MALSPGDVNARRATDTSSPFSAACRRRFRSSRALSSRSALQRDPYQLATLYNATAKHAGARELLHKALELAPQHELAKRELAFTELLDGHPSLALATVPGLGQDWTKSLVTALAQHSLGNRRESDAALARLVSAAGTTAMYQIAQVHAWRGEQDEALEWLERARLGHDPASATSSTTRSSAPFEAICASPHFSSG